MDIGYGIWDIGYIDMGLDIKRVPVFEHTHTYTHTLTIMPKWVLCSYMKLFPAIEMQDTHELNSKSLPLITLMIDKSWRRFMNEKIIGQLIMRPRS